MKLSPIEDSELAFDELVRAMRGREVDFEHALGALEAHARRTRSLTPREADASLEALVREHARTSWAEAHALGWFHQRWFRQERDASFAGHTSREDKHDAPVHATQIYTPRWLADALAYGALDALDAHDALPSVCDPACGPGQMLLAALDALAARHPDASAPALAGALHGCDLDEDAVRTARACLLMRLEELRGVEELTQVARVLETNVVCGDGLEEHTETFDVVLANPPYMGARAMPKELRSRLKRDFDGFHLDLCVAFMRRCVDLSHGAVGLLVQQTVWFLARFERARGALLEDAPLRAFYHVGTRAFGALTGEKANVTASVHARAGGEDAVFVDLRSLATAADKRDALAAGRGARTRSLDALGVIPGAPIAHWLPDTALRAFARFARLEEIATIPGSQNKTGANATYVRPWADVDPSQLRRADALAQDAEPDGRWVFYSKGGRYAPWWGNWGNVVDWSQDARRFYETNRTSNLLAREHWFRPGLCYTDFAGSQFNARLMPEGCVFDMAGPAIFVDGDDPTTLLALLALLNASPTRELLGALNPSIHYQVRDLRNLPVPPLAPARDELAAAAARAVDAAKRLHTLLEGDPLHDEEAQHSEVFEDALDALTRAERECDALTRELYEWEDGSGAALPEHHVVGRLRRPR